NTYCIVRQDNAPKNITTDGNCGKQINYKASCVGSTFGDCCNAAGKCGSGESFCGKGNCQDGKCEGGLPYSTDGKCGRDFDYLPCPPKFGLCCSGAGQCGNLTQYCNAGCQSGPCLATSTTISLPPTATPTNKPPPGSISSDGTCAYNDGWTCKGSKLGDCCSAAGYCGKTEYECSPYLGW
ncbi:carbohydrate-binding module family 18 protein, partial [Melanomma pulvis-pyrius CBS 109.77]